MPSQKVRKGKEKEVVQRQLIPRRVYGAGYLCQHCTFSDLLTSWPTNNSRENMSKVAFQSSHLPGFQHVQSQANIKRNKMASTTPQRDPFTLLRRLLEC